VGRELADRLERPVIVTSPRKLLPFALAALLALAGCYSKAPPAVDNDQETGVTITRADVQWSFADSLKVTAPPDLYASALPACARRVLPPGWVQRENTRAGDPGWNPVDLSFTPAVPLYLDRTSTMCGESVGVHVSAAGGAPLTIRAYRMGWYGGAGARLVWESQVLTPPVISPDSPSTSTTLVSPGWPTLVRLPVDPAWPPGVYLITTVTAGTVSGSAPLVVRSGGPAAPYVMVHSTLTWAAYSSYGGTSLYRGPGGRSARALQSDLARPTTGNGLAQFVYNELPLVQFAERLGLTVDHVTDIDLDAWPSLLVGHATVILPGHNEYWTLRMYDALVAARNDGINIADLGANEIYWQTRITHDASGAATAMFVARTLKQDPQGAAHPDTTTVQWSADPLNRDPTAVIGQGYSAVQVRGSVAVLTMPSWLSGGTGLTVGSLLDGLVANEADGARAKAPGTPPNLQVIAGGVLTRRGFRTEPVTTTYYSAPSGAGVFAAGITYWTCNLNDACPPGLGAASATRFEVRALTANLLADFGQPRFGSTHPSKRFVPVSTEALQKMLPPKAIGRYGPGI
jgi:hypothetical protein